MRDGVAAIGMVAIGGPVLEASVAARGSGKAGPRRACGCGAEAVCAGTASPWGRPWWTGSPSAARPATAPPATRVTVRWLRQGEAAALAAAWATLPCRGEAAAIRAGAGSRDARERCWGAHRGRGPGPAAQRRGGRRRSCRLIPTIPARTRYQYFDGKCRRRQWTAPAVCKCQPAAMMISSISGCEKRRALPRCGQTYPCTLSRI